MKVSRQCCSVQILVQKRYEKVEDDDEDDGDDDDEA